MAQQPTVNARLVDEAIRHAHTLSRFGAGLEARAAKRVSRELVPALVAEIARLDGLGKPSERLRQTLVATNRLVNETVEGWRKAQQRDMRDFALTEAEWQRRVLRDAVPFNYSFLLPGRATLDQLVNKPVVGKNVTAWYGDMARATKRGVEQSLRVGLAAGDSIPQLAARIRQGPGQRAKRSAAMIARTSANDVSARAREATYAANKDVVRGVQIVATLDSRTSPICQSEDGEVYPVGAGPRPPFHPFCRTTTVPVLESWEKFGVDPARVPEATRATMSGQVPERVKYGDWLRSQAPHVQNAALGPTRAQLFREGKVAIDRFVGPAGKPLTLAQLRTRVIEPSLARRVLAPVVSGSTKLLRQLDWRTPKAVKVVLRFTNKYVINYGSAAAEQLYKLSGADSRTIKRAMGFAGMGDWLGFGAGLALAAPLPMVSAALLAVPPGSITAAAIAIPRIGIRGVKAASALVRKLAGGARGT